MPNRRLTQPEIDKLDALQTRVVSDLDSLAAGDPQLLFALRRRLFTRLMHLERGTPAHRTKLKAAKWNAQKGKCMICGEPMPQKGSELDRIEAWKGYTAENTRLVHHDCHVDDQRKKGFTDAEAELVERIGELEEMTIARDVAEFWDGEGWRQIDIESALKLPARSLMRCPACHGKVRAHKEGTTGQRAHFEHVVSHAGCPTKNGFSGEASTHPQPLR